MLKFRQVYFVCETLSRFFLSLEINPHPTLFTWAKTMVMQWNARVKFIVHTSKNVLTMLSLEDGTPCCTDNVLTIGDPGGRYSRPGLRGRPTRLPLPPPLGMPRPRLC